MTDSVIVHLDVAAGDVDIASGSLWACGAVGVQELVGDGETIRLVAGMAADGPDRLRAEFGNRWPLSVEPADYDGWVEAWRPFARPIRAGRFVVYPAWEDPPDAAPDEIAVAIDAGPVFGQGSHVTTRLVLEELGTLDLAGRSVLDVGTGSGVLAIAAARLGAERVTAIDIEPDSIGVAVENATRNGVADQLTISDTPIDLLDGRFPLVVANILAPVLVELAPEITARLEPGGTLLLSGLLAQQCERVLAAYDRLSLVDEQVEDGWNLLRLVR